MSNKQTDARKGKATEIDLDAFEAQIDSEVDRLFTVPKTSTEWAAKLRKTASEREGSQKAIESQAQEYKELRSANISADQESKLSFFENGNNDGKGIDIDLDIFEERINLEIDKVFDVVVVPLSEAERLPEITAPKEVLQKDTGLDPSALDDLEASPPAMDKDRDKAIGSGRADAEEPNFMAADFDAFEDQVNLEIDGLFPTSANSRFSREPLPKIGLSDESFREATESEPLAPDFAETIGLDLPRGADREAPLLAETVDKLQLEVPKPEKSGIKGNTEAISQDNEYAGSVLYAKLENELSMDIDVAGPAQVDASGLHTGDYDADISQSRPQVVFEPLEWDDRAIPSPAQSEGPVLHPEPPAEAHKSRADISLPTEPDQKSKLIESLSVALLTLDWDFNAESIAELDLAVMNLEPYCLEIHEASSIAKILRAVLRHLKVRLDSVSSPLMQFISDASGFLLVLLRSKTAPGAAENAELNSLADRLRTIKSQGARIDAEGETIKELVLDFSTLQTDPEQQIIAVPIRCADPPTGNEPIKEIEPAENSRQMSGAEDLALDDSYISFEEPSGYETSESEKEDFTQVESNELEAESSQAIEPTSVFELQSQPMSMIEPSEMERGSSEQIESDDELAWLFESLDIALVSLEWDFTAQNIEVLAQAMTYLEPYFRNIREAGFITRILHAILQSLKSRPESSPPELLGFISNAMDFLKLCIRNGIDHAGQNREQLRHLIDSLREIDGHTFVSPLGQDEVVPSHSFGQIAEADEMSLLFDPLDIAYVCLHWSFKVENVAALDLALVALEPYCRKSREAGSIFRMLRAVLQRLKIKPDSVTPPLLELISDALEYFKLYLRAGSTFVPENKDSLKSLVDRLRAIKSRCAMDDEINDVAPDAAHRLEPGQEKGALQPMGLEMLEAVDGSSVQEFRAWMESCLARSKDAVQSLGREVNRLLQLEEVLAAKPVLAPVVARLSKVRSTLSEQIAACCEAEHEWNNRMNQLLDWERRISALPAALDTEIKPPPLSINPTSTSTPELLDGGVESTSPEAEKQVVHVRQEQVCLFDLAGECMALPASHVVKFKRVSGKQAKKLLDRGYATLTDFKPLFRGLKSGLLGTWKSLPSNDLRTYRFLPVPHDLLCTACALSEEPSSTDSGNRQVTPSTVRGVVLVSNAHSHGMLFTESASMDLRNETIEIASPEEATLGMIRTGSQSPIRVLSPDILLKGLAQEDSDQS